MSLAWLDGSTFTKVIPMAWLLYSLQLSSMNWWGFFLICGMNEDHLYNWPLSLNVIGMIGRHHIYKGHTHGMIALLVTIVINDLIGLFQLTTLVSANTDHSELVDSACGKHEAVKLEEPPDSPIHQSLTSLSPRWTMLTQQGAQTSHQEVLLSTQTQHLAAKGLNVSAGK